MTKIVVAVMTTKILVKRLPQGRRPYAQPAPAWEATRTKTTKTVVADVSRIIMVTRPTVMPTRMLPKMLTRMLTRMLMRMPNT